jgi:hypothetical protein
LRITRKAGALRWEYVQNIRGNVAHDILLAIIAYPFVVVQIHDEAAVAIESGEKPTTRKESV